MSGENSARVLVLHGPNLNLLGTREPEIYGSLTLGALNAQCEAAALSLGLDVHFAQHNSEGQLIDSLHHAGNTDLGVIFNPGGYTHTSVALHDAIRALEIPVVEVHLSNIYKREDFRQRSITGAACVGVIQGFGADSYRLALHHLAGVLTTSTLEPA